VNWTEQDVLVGDAEALVAICKAERVFERELVRGATAYRLEAGKPVERLEQFDPQPIQIIMVHRYRGSARTLVVLCQCGFLGCRLEA